LSCGTKCGIKLGGCEEIAWLHMVGISTRKIVLQGILKKNLLE